MNYITLNINTCPSTYQNEVLIFHLSYVIIKKNCVVQWKLFLAIELLKSLKIVNYHILNLIIIFLNKI